MLSSQIAQWQKDGVYLNEAQQLVEMWVEAGYPHTIACDSPLPFGLLVVRRAPNVFGMPEPNSFAWMPEIHFWHYNKSLVVIRAYPILWEVVDKGLTTAGKLVEGTILATHSNLLCVWANDGYLSVKEYRHNVTGGFYRSFVYCDNARNEHGPQALFPYVESTFHPETDEELPVTPLGHSVWRPVGFGLRWEGVWNHDEIEAEGA